MKAAACGLIFILLSVTVVGSEQLSVSSDSVIAALASSDSAVRVPPGFRAKEGTAAESYTNTGWAKEVIHEKTGIEMVFIPAGEFMMGSPESEKDRGSDEPLHKVRIAKPFYLGKYEVTNAQYRLYESSHDSGTYIGLSLDGNKQPVVNVSWDDAKAYCDWAGLELPTEAEWEYSCRAGSKGRFWWGESESEAGRHANVADRTTKARWDWSWCFDTDDGNAVTSAVGAYDANAFGLYDMIGNACEWCADWHVVTSYVSSPGTRVIRGGSWFDGPGRCRSARRDRIPPIIPHGGSGFRVARGL